MSDETPKHPKLAELENLISEQDKRDVENAERRRRELADPRVQRGLEALVIHDLDEYLTPAADALTSAIVRLAEKLTEIGLIGADNPGIPDYIADLTTGEMIPAIHVEGGTYWEQGTELIEQREAKGRIEFRQLNDDGTPAGEWRTASPARSTSASN